MPNDPAFFALFSAIADAIAAADGAPFVARSVHAAGGSGFSRNFRIGDGRRHFFVKVATGGASRFAAEADGLAALARCDALVVPRVVAAGAAGDDDFLAIEWLELDGAGDEALLGEAVAALHGTLFPRYGWHCDNFIGGTPQTNGWLDDWPTFFADRRLRPQFALAAQQGIAELAARAEPLLARLPALLAGTRPAAALQHGDLWRGNAGFVGGRPALFDPAVFAGDAESDLAMCELFGGFSPRFFAAYRSLRPEPPEAGIRRELYRLYHLLNHANLFGGGYVRQAVALVDRLAGTPR